MTRREAIEHYGEYKTEIIDAMISVMGEDYLEELDELYQGHWNSQADYARNLVDECYNVDDFIKTYIDFEWMGKELLMDYYYSDNGYLFRA